MQRCLLPKKLKHLSNFLRIRASFVTSLLDAVQPRARYPNLTIGDLFHRIILLL